MRPRTIARKATGVRLDRVVAAAAEAAARDSHRTVSNLIELALIQYLEREGYLPSEKLRKLPVVTSVRSPTINRRRLERSIVFMMYPALTFSTKL